jgi:hypothetical protein
LGAVAEPSDASHRRDKQVLCLWKKRQREVRLQNVRRPLSRNLSSLVLEYMLQKNRG